jgi:prolyl-tRNA synthetase
MRYSGFYIPTLREDPKGVEFVSHKLMLKAGMIDQLGSGIYTKLPLFYRIFIKLWQILREEMDRAGGNEMCFPAIHPSKLWRESGRWDAYGDDMFKFVDRHGREMCLAPTHEIAAAALVKPFVHSYRDLPIRIYQTQTKFRDELRPRGGVLRTREFTMKDLYSYDKDVPSMNCSYQAVVDGYCRVCDRLNMTYIAVQTSETGQIGGDLSHEFFAIAECGDDTVYYCEKCKSGASGEDAAGKVCSTCGTPYTKAQGIEIGHCFQLGTQYSDVVELAFTNEDGRRQSAFSPFEVAIALLKLDDDLIMYAEGLYQQCLEAGLDVLFDDRDISVGSKLSDLDLIGIPLQIVVGRESFDQGLAEIKMRRTGMVNLVPRTDAVRVTATMLAELQVQERAEHVSLEGKVVASDQVQHC